MPVVVESLPMFGPYTTVMTVGREKSGDDWHRFAESLDSQNPVEESDDEGESDQ
jgi:hypothetical protein